MLSSIPRLSSQSELKKLKDKYIEQAPVGHDDFYKIIAERNWKGKRFKIEAGGFAKGAPSGEVYYFGPWSLTIQPKACLGQFVNEHVTVFFLNEYVVSGTNKQSRYKVKDGLTICKTYLKEKFDKEKYFGIEGEIRTYDVWGNARDGFEVNDCWSQGNLTFRMPFSNKIMLQDLHEAGWLEGYGPKSLEIEGDEYTTYYNDARNGKPLLEVRFERD